MYTCTTSTLGHSAAVSLPTLVPNRLVPKSEVPTTHVPPLLSISNRSQCRSTFDAAYATGRRHRLHRHGEPASYWARSLALVASKASRCSMSPDRGLCVRGTTGLSPCPITVRRHGLTRGQIAHRTRPACQPAMSGLDFAGSTANCVIDSQAIRCNRRASVRAKQASQTVGVVVGSLAVRGARSFEYMYIRTYH